MSYYIAYSIPGTSTFITASREVFRAARGFTPVQSRRPNAKPTDIKLHWDKLVTKKGEPIRSAPLVLKLFNELEKSGWTVDKARFIKKHWKDKKKCNKSEGLTS